MSARLRRQAHAGDPRRMPHPIPERVHRGYRIWQRRRRPILRRGSRRRRRTEDGPLHRARPRDLPRRAQEGSALEDGRRRRRPILRRRSLLRGRGRGARASSSSSPGSPPSRRCECISRTTIPQAWYPPTSVSTTFARWISAFPRASRPRRMSCFSRVVAVCQIYPRSPPRSPGRSSCTR